MTPISKSPISWLYLQGIISGASLFVRTAIYQHIIARSYQYNPISIYLRAAFAVPFSIFCGGDG
ncbi:hypothetical protein OE88DRAFT_1660679 [Heliocybe sulcata]|uniref:Uncharacterized protein n=1 Tax=Heliocybe sulcata TaxID=5364 RepID=A0A5C3N005_9AGAM|nr:hypothetical protein OE88DRAFT_1660679 [Heliocybe sulcata]